MNRVATLFKKERVYVYRERNAATGNTSGYPTTSDPEYGDSGQRPRNKTPILVALVALLVAAIAGASYLMAQQLQGQSAATTASKTAGASQPSATTRPDLTIPANNGWTSVAPSSYGDVQFTAAMPERGYLCGSGSDNKNHIFGVTKDHGQTWSISDSPALYMTCSLQLSLSNPLDLTLTSINEPGDGQSAYVEAHYSTDGGKSWKAAPIPPNTLVPANLFWSGQYLYLARQYSLEVSMNGGPFTSIPLSGIVPGESDVFLTSAVATADTVYLNVQTKGCQSPCDILLASSNGGASWAKIPNSGNVLLQFVQGNTFYGNVLNGQPFVTSVLRSTDGGATWQTIAFPPLPGNVNTSSYLVAPDQTIYTSSLAGVAALRNSAWSVLPVSSSDRDFIQVTAISLDASGHPQKVWGVDGGIHPGIYWHNL
jgi:BNR/Asp-box repeat protein